VGFWGISRIDNSEVNFMRSSVSNCAWLKTCLHRFAGAFLLAFVVLLASLPAFSQGTAGRILGAVTDQTGGAMSGATVTIIDTQRNTTRTLTADDSGEYSAPNLLPSTYTIRAEAKGFKTAERTNIILEVGQDLRVDLTLQPGEQTERITVTEALPMVETTNAELGGTLQSQIIADLPMNGRNFANLLQLRPGVTIYPGGSGWTQSTNGQRAHDNVYLFDGVNGSDPWMAQPIISAVMGAGDAGTLISIDAIDEFKTEENPRAEYGWKPGAIVNVGIKSGTNAMHGTAFAYGRDGSWDALPYFSTAGLNGGVALAPPPLALEQFGATLGGPIKKDKLFYFASFEDQRYSVGSTGQITDPITAPGVGILTATPTVPINNMIAACQAVLAAGATPAPLSLQLTGLSSTCTPLPNYPGLFPVVNSSNATIPNALNNTNRIDSGIAKIDYHITDKHSLNGMYEISPGNGILNDGPGTQTEQTWLTDQYARSQVFAANWTWVPTSTWVNEFRVGYSHYFQDFETNDHTQNPANYSFNGSTYNVNTGQTNPLYFGFPVINMPGFTGGLGGANWPKVVGPNGVLQLMDHVSYLKGKHAFKFGGEVLYNRSTSDVTSNTRGTLTFGSIEDFFSGVPNSSLDPLDVGNGNAAILAGNLVRHFTYTGYAAFFQDDWRIKPRLTLNLGMRYEITTVPKEANGLQGNFIPGQGLLQTNSPYAGDHNNFSPRLGFAWDVFGNGKTVLRGGGGILYEQLSLDVFQGIGNSFGLRVEPTGDTLCSGGVNGVGGSCTAGTGTISVANVSLSPGLALDGGPSNAPPATFATAAPGSLAANWGLNSPNGRIFPFVAACGDGNTVLTGTVGIQPSQCNAIEVDPKLRTPYVETWTLDLQRALTNNLSLDIGYVGNHGVKLIGALDINQDTPVTLNVPGVGTVVTGPGWNALSLSKCASTAIAKNCKPSSQAEQNGRPYNTAFPYLKYIDYFGNLDTSNYNGLQVVLTARNYHGLTLTGGYTYAHSLGESSDQGTSGGLQIPANSYGCFRCQLYTSTAFDMRHRLTISGTYAIPGRKGFGQMLQGWSINSAAVIQTGTPWGINDSSTDFAGIGEANGRNPSANEGMQWDFFGNPSDFEAIHNFSGVNPMSGVTYTFCSKTVTFNCLQNVTGILFFPGGGGIAAPTANATCNQKAAAMGPLATASLNVLGCYGLGSSVLVPPAYGSFGTMPRNPWRDQGFRNWDASISKVFKINERLSAQFRAEFFNVLNTVNFVNPFGGPGGSGTANNINPSKAGGATGLGYVHNTPDAASSNPILGSGGNRDMQLGLKLIF
jgi:carboxypeptidase family protein/TonB-dependent receptor-like protein